MQLPTFIRLENSIEAALSYYNSPQMKHFSFYGVQLLRLYLYRQRTYAPQGIELETWEHVYVCDLCGKRLADIYQYFDVVETFNDPATGRPQIIWQIKDCPFDAGFQPVYLEIISGVNAPIYSSVFYLTNSNGEFTSNWYYRNKETDTMLAIGLGLYFHYEDDEQEVSNYTAISSGEAFTASSIVTPFEHWKTGIIDLKLFRTIKNLFKCRYIYSLPADFGDQLAVRTSLKEAIETPKPEADENFGEGEVKLYRRLGQTYDPLAPVVVPLPPPVIVPVINLISVSRIQRGQVRYDFNYSQYPTAPVTFTLQYSLSTNGPWASNSGGTSSPRLNAVPEQNIYNYYYRIVDLSTGTISNVIQVAAPSIEIINVTDNGRPSGFGTTFYIQYKINNFTPNFRTLKFQISINNTNYDTYIFSSNSQNINADGIYTQRLDALPSDAQNSYFRIKYDELGLVSNTYER